ncbi:MAG: hypothetical protein AB7F79_03880 [Steroidobacteraceae bacterium]
MHQLLQLILLATTLALAPSAHADFYIVVEASNPQQSLTQKQVVDLFMGRSRSFTNGEFSVLLDLPRDNPTRAEFYQALTGLSAAQVNSYWSRLMFSGRNTPPTSFKDEATIIAMLKRNPNAIGWLSTQPTDKRLRTLLVIKR